MMTKFPSTRIAATCSIKSGATVLLIPVEKNRPMYLPKGCRQFLLPHLVCTYIPTGLGCYFGATRS
jgi:hypothetical protein